MAKRKSNQRKRKESKKIETINNFDGDILGKVTVAVCALCFLLAFYLLTVHITNKNTNKKKDDKEEVTISSENIILGRSLSMSDDDYLVIFYDKSDEESSSTYANLVSTYKYSGTDHMKIYTVDMSNGLNKRFSTDGESNKNPESVKDFKINGPTLILVSNHTVSEYIEGEEDITNYLS